MKQTAFVNHDPIEAEFDQLKAMYPKREGANPWKGKAGALCAYRARRKEGVSFQDVLEGLKRYSRFCIQTQIIGTSFVMQAKRFFGPGEEWTNPW